jgi:peptidoglycan/xylan/chitin deacetylase (PgdA/CDA1 family)
MKLIITIILVTIVSVLVGFNTLHSFAETTGSIQLSVNYQNGDVASTSNMSVIVYQDHEVNPFINKTKVSTLPYTISSLPLNHLYKVEVYQGSMHSGYGVVNLKNNQQNLDLFIQPTMGMRFFVFYNDGETPITGVNLTVKSYDGVVVADSPTDNNGQTLTIWAPTSTRTEDYYLAEVTMGPEFVYKIPPITASYPGKRDIKIVTDWPKEITNLITIKVYKDNTTLVDKLDGVLGVEIRDSKNNIIKDQLVNKKGEVSFSNLKIGEYFVFIVKNPYSKTGDYKEIFSKKIILKGSESTINIFMNEPVKLPLSSKTTKPMSNATKTTPSETTKPMSNATKTTPSETTKPTVPNKTPKPIVPNKTPKPITPGKLVIPNCNCIAFTLDGIQDYYISNVQLAIIKSFQQKEAGLTAGVYGKTIGNNAKIVGQLKNMVSKENHLLELANRGWENLDHSQFSKDIQSTSIQKTNDKLLHLFDVTPLTFMPPSNSFNGDTINALRENGILYYSSQGKVDSKSLALHKNTPLFVPQTLQVSDLLEDDLFYEGTINDKALTKIKKSLDANGFVVINIQAKNFAVKDGDERKNQVDLEQLQNLESLLDFIKSNGIKIVPINQIVKEIPSQKLPYWTSKILDWYESGKISEQDLENARNYLINNVYSNSYSNTKDMVLNNSTKDPPPILTQTESPIVIAPTNILTVTTNKEDTLHYIDDIGIATATDNSTPNNKIVITNDAPDSDESGIPFPLGTTRITWTAKDTDGNIGIAYQNVTVIANPLDKQTDQNNKRIMLNFDDGFASVYNFGLPIFEKYNIKTTQYIICGKIKENQTNYMSWDDIQKMVNAGHDIQSHGMSHLSVNGLSETQLESEFGQNVIDCFKNHGITDIRAASLPLSQGWDQLSVTKIIDNYYEFARGDSTNAVFSLHCDKGASNQKNCETYTSEEETDLNPFNRYNIRGWKHDAKLEEVSFDEAAMFSKFIRYVNQASSNTPSETLTIPIVVYHKEITNSDPAKGISVTLLDAEMKYLHDNNFTTFTTKDLTYDYINNWITITPSES